MGSHVQETLKVNSLASVQGQEESLGVFKFPPSTGPYPTLPYPTLPYPTQKPSTSIPQVIIPTIEQFTKYQAALSKAGCYTLG